MHSFVQFHITKNENFRAQECIFHSPVFRKLFKNTPHWGITLRPRVKVAKSNQLNPVEQQYIQNSRCASGLENKQSN